MGSTTPDNKDKGSIEMRTRLPMSSTSGVNAANTKPRPRLSSHRPKNAASSASGSAGATKWPQIIDAAVMSPMVRVIKKPSSVARTSTVSIGLTCRSANNDRLALMAPTICESGRRNMKNASRPTMIHRPVSMPPTVRTRTTVYMSIRNAMCATGSAMIQNQLVRLANNRATASRRKRARQTARVISVAGRGR